MTALRLQEFVEDEVFSPTLIAGALWTTKTEIVSTLGLGQGRVFRATRVRARKTQPRLREMMETYAGWRRIPAARPSSPMRGPDPSRCLP
ncbi:MAG: hypothetical protein OXJ90_13495 [Spirochaetaceae bacterium]|nr:hypothetical protein [Spirochaetaceae bacterium]